MKRWAAIAVLAVVALVLAGMFTLHRSNDRTCADLWEETVTTTALALGSAMADDDVAVLRLATSARDLTIELREAGCND